MFDSNLRVNKQDALPRYAQVKQLLREMIATGRLQPGEKIPSEVQIAEALGVSKMTVNKALLALTQDGFLVREVGRGTFVAQPENPAFATASPSGVPRVVLSFVEGAKNVLDSDYYGTIYRGIEEVLGQRTQTLKGATTERVMLAVAPLAAADYQAEDARDKADGRIIVAPRVESVPSIEQLWQDGKAVIVVGASWPAMGVPSVDSDNTGGATEAVRHLLELGHTRIALLYAESETANTQDRITGYRRALAAHGILPNPAFEVQAEKVWKAGNSAKNHLTALFRQSEPVTAVFAAGHYLALEAKNVVREAGLAIPGDVSVVGFDDPLSAQLVYPPLTTVRQPLQEMGHRAAERILRLIAGEDRTAIREMLPAQLVVRQSTARVQSPVAGRRSLSL